MFLDIVGNIQPLTKALLLFSIILGFTVYTGVVSKFDFFFNFDKIVFQFQVWRIVTSVYYISEFNSGDFSIISIIKLAMFLQFSASIQRSGFKRGSIDYLFMLFVLHLVLFVFASVFKIYSLNDIFMFVLYYLNGRKDMNQIIIINFLPIRSPYLVWYLVYVNWVIRKLDITQNIISILIGHTFYIFGNLSSKMAFFPWKDALDTPNWFLTTFGALFDRGVVIPREVIEQNDN